MDFVQHQEEGLILIVDDEPDSLAALVSTLERQHLQVLVSMDMPSALESLTHVLPDLILLDICLPGASGYQLLEYLQGDRRYRDIPVLIISALDEGEHIVQGLSTVQN